MPRRRRSSAGSRPSSRIETTSSHAGASRSGLPRMAVAIAAAWISGPDTSVPAEVSWRSCSDGADAPTTTIFPRSALAGTLPWSTSMNATVGIVPAPPGKSISRRWPGLARRPVRRWVVAVAMLGSRPT